MKERENNMKKMNGMHRALCGMRNVLCGIRSMFSVQYSAFNVRCSAFSARLLTLCVFLSISAAAAAWTATATISVAPEGSGLVSFDNSTWKLGDTKSETDQRVWNTISWNAYAKANDGYYFTGWSENSASGSTSPSTSTTQSIKLTFREQSATYYANFAAVTSAASGTNPLVFYPESLASTETKSVTFTTTGADNIADFNNATIAAASGSGGTWTVTNTTYSNNTVTVTFTYTANRSTYKNSGGTRTDKAVITLISKGNHSATFNVSAVHDLTISAGSSTALSLSYPTASVSGTATFPVTKVDNASEVTASIANGTGGSWAIGTPTYADNEVTVPYTFPPTTDTAGTYTATITLTDAYGMNISNTATATVNINKSFVGEIESTYITIPAGSTADGTGTATIQAAYVAGVNEFTIAMENPNGTWALRTANYATGTPVGTLTIPYTFTNPGAAGDYSVDLKITLGGVTKTVTLKATMNKDVGNNVAEVTTAGGTVTMYETWAAALVKANEADGSTITLLQDIDLGTLTGNQTFTKTTTLDLSGKVLSGVVNSKGAQLLYLNTDAKTLTIMDSKSGGTIKATTADQQDRRAVTISKGNLILNSGTLSITSTNTNTSDNRIAGVYLSSPTATFTMNAGTIKADHTVGGGARGVYLVAGAKATLNGGTVEAVAMKAVYGVIAESSASVESEINVKNNATIRATATASAHGIYSYGKVNVSGGTIESETKTIGSTAGASNAYGICLTITNDANPAKSCYGVLDMTGGTVSAISAANYAYGVYFDSGYAALSTNATDGSHTNKSVSYGTISNATITATTTKNNAYGVLMQGSYNSKTNTYDKVVLRDVTVNVQAFQNAYGILSNAAVHATYGGMRFGWIEAYNCNVKAHVTNPTYNANPKHGYSYAVYLQVAQNTATKEGYEGEFATGGKMYIEGGTYTATSAGSHAYAVYSGTRAITLKGNAEGYADLTINGGTFKAEAQVYYSYGIYSGGNTTIEGGAFTAISKTSSTAYAGYIPSGKTTATNTSFTATAYTNTACAVIVSGGCNAYTMHEYSGEVILNNVTATATSQTNSTAYALHISGDTREQTQATYDALNETNKTTYKDVYYIGGKAAAGKATVNGGTYTATAYTTTAVGINMKRIISNTGMARAWGKLYVKDAIIKAESQTSYTVYGVNTNGEAEIDNCKITAKAATTNAYGVLVYDGHTRLTNNKIYAEGKSASGNVNVRGVLVHATVTNSDTNNAKDSNGNLLYYAGLKSMGELESENNVVEVYANGGSQAYGLYVNATAITTTKTPAHDLANGNFACAGKATVTNDEYIVLADVKDAYGVYIAAEQTKGEASAAPECTIHSAKLYSEAPSTYADINTAGLTSNVSIEDGFFRNATNVERYVVEGKAVVDLPATTTEYGEGYRYFLGQATAPGIGVCKVITANSTTEYKTLEEALQVVNSNTTAATIVMINSYTLNPGNYILPAHATLLVPHSASQTEIKGADVEKTNTWTTPSVYLTLTFAEGVSLTVKGKIEVGGKMSSNGGEEGATTGTYGHLHLEKNTYIDMEAEAAIYAWGYVTGEGTINVKDGAFAYENFQLGNWPGGKQATAMKNKVLAITDYAYQNIECNIIYHAGSRAYAATALYVQSQNVDLKPIMLLGEKGEDALFTMDPAKKGENLWVKKKYDAATDIIHWIFNSAVTMSNIIIDGTYTLGFINVPVSFNSKDYILPLASNMHITINSGVLDMEYDVLIQPGVSLNINKEAKFLVPSATSLYVVDKNQWQKNFSSNSGTCYLFTPHYSPSWVGTSSPRKKWESDNTTLPSAEIFVHGMMEIEGNLLTSAGGANIHSTNEDAGKVYFVNGASTTSTLYQLLSNTDNGTYDSYECTSAQLKNEITSTPYTATTNATAGQSFNYIEDQWVALTEGCLSTREDGSGTHYYAYPSDVVEVNGGNKDYTYSDIATNQRLFINTGNPTSAISCAWWEVEQDAEGYYASNSNYANYEGYYFYDVGSNYWTPVTVNVKWVSEGTTLSEYAMHKGTRPVYVGNAPTKAGSNWTGWTTPDGTFYDRNDTLPRVTVPTTFTAAFDKIINEYTITFKSRDGSVLQAGLWEKDAMPVCSVEVADVYTVDKVYTFNGNWDPAIKAVSGPQDYTAKYTESARSYKIRFENYDGTLLFADDFAYGSTPSYRGVPPTRESTWANSYEFSGWKSSTGGTALAAVTGEETYTAQYTVTERTDYGTWLDVVNAESGKLTFNMNGYSSESAGTDWTITVNTTNYTKDKRAKDRTLTVDLPTGTKADDKVLIQVKGKKDVVESSHKYTIPHVYTTNTTLGTVAADNSSVIFVKEGTLTINNDVSVAAIYVEPGAELKINSGKTLTVAKLVLRTTGFASAVLTDEGKLVCAEMYYSRVVSDRKHFYPIALPFDSELSKVRYSNGVSAQLNKHFGLMEYNSQKRANEGIKDADGKTVANWISVDSDKMHAKQGYMFISTSAYYTEYYFPVKKYTPDAKNPNVKIAISAYIGDANKVHHGWNALGSPYTGKYTCEYDDPSEAIKINVLVDTESYLQQPAEVITPATMFFYQTAENGKLSFGKDAFSFEPSSTPKSVVARRTAQTASRTTQTQWIRLEYSNEAGQVDETHIYLHPDKFSASYDMGYDVQKLSTSGSLPFMWTSLSYGDLAFAALPDALATDGIALSLFAPTAGNMALTLLDNKWMSRLQRLYLIDTEERMQVDLLTNDYEWFADAGTTTGRFFLYPILKAPNQGDMTTDLSSTDSEALVAYNVDKHIIIENLSVGAMVRCFDVAGKLIASGTATTTTMMLPVPTTGLYFIHADNGVCKVMVTF